MKYITICKALYDYDAQTEEELSFKEDDILYILEKDDDDWWKAQLKIPSLEQIGPVGLIPANYITEADSIGAVKALYDYQAQQEEELTIKEDDILILYENDDPDWFLVKSEQGHIGLVPSNYIEEINDHEEASTTNGGLADGHPPASVSPSPLTATPEKSHTLNTNDEAVSWSVNEYDTEKKKKKKSKGNLLVGNGMLCYGSETDKVSPVRQFAILDVTNYSQDGKNLHIEIGDATKTVLDFQASSKSEAKAVIVKIEESKLTASAGNPIISTPIPPSTQQSHITHDTQFMEEAASYRQSDQSNQIHEPTAKPEPELEIPDAACEPKWAIVLYDFEAEGEGEISVKTMEQVLVTDYVSSNEWWTIEHKDGSTGIVPMTYVKFQDEYEAQLAAEDEMLRKQELEEAERQRIEAENAAALNRRQEEEERERQRMEEEKEKNRQLEAERRRKMQEEAKQRELDAKRLAARSAAAVVSPPPIQGSASPRRSQIPAPPPPVKSQPTRAVSADNAATSERPKQTHDSGKPDPAKVRVWTDRTGAFKVEAQFLAVHNGKIRLHKTNGVKIDVPVQKMCIEDIRFIERESGLKLLEDRNDNIPLAHLASKGAETDRSKKGWDWFDFFTKANIPMQSSLRYATSFQAERLGENDVQKLTHRRMKSLGMTERHVQRLQRFIETEVAEPASDDEDTKKSAHKGKKTVTFGATSIIDDGAEAEDDGYYAQGSASSDNVQWQIEQDERLARQLQEEENKGSNSPVQRSVGLQRRGTGRPTPSNAAPKDVNSDILEKIKSQLSTEPLKPSPAVPISPALPSAPPATALPQQPASNKQTSHVGFEDDAWAPRASSPIAMPASSKTAADEAMAQTKAAWSAPAPPAPPPPPPAPVVAPPANNLNVQPMMNSTQVAPPPPPRAPPVQQAPVPLPPRQRPTPQLSQQNKVDSQLLSQWTNGANGNNSATQQSSVPQPQQPTPSATFPHNSGTLQQQAFVMQQQAVSPQAYGMQQQQQTPIMQVQPPQIQASQPQSYVNLQQQPQVTGMQLPPQQLQPYNQAANTGMQFMQVPLQQSVQNPQFTGMHPTPSVASTTVPLSSVLPAPLVPSSASMAGMQPQQMTGFGTPAGQLNSPSMNSPNLSSRTWANANIECHLAAPENPFGNTPSQTPQMTGMQQYPTSAPAPSPSQVFASMTGQRANGQVPQTTGFSQFGMTSQANNPNDKYAVFKNVDSNSPSLFNQAQQTFQQPQQTGFVQMQAQAFNGSGFANQVPPQQQQFYNRW
ncbi:cytoskeletal protein binding protein [Apophysomyces ossiformis]|uniref:Actin cytoskeleton-regulatory complex protein SLA1 n=1 Tax=Apophysomyces ossiformis TaxID=679940 RepID=A0A8H7EVH1_9FUNG|nr:cytoskeletal protein binding protein [Apophysomyces ossiformis]